MIAALSTPAPEAPQLRDIAPPVDVFPYPPWMVATAGVLALLIVTALVWLIVRKMRNRPPPRPPTARSIALRELQKLRGQMRQTDPHAFSFAVSDVLRSYITSEYRVQATQQTSPEFLAAIAQSVKFHDADRKLLGEFLERCDLIKFARIDADPGDSERLLESAMAFVQGGAAVR